MRNSLAAALIFLCAAALGGAPPTEPDQANPAAGKALPQRVAAEHLPNAFRVHEKVISGGQPDGDAGFAELARLGVKTIITVDGAKPDVERARQRGMRYVHLPHGYDGISPARAQQLAKAVRDLPGPIYIHCHHGKHRSPAAASVACLTLGWLKPQETAEVLRLAGTSPHYRGLHQAAATTPRVAGKLLDELAADFPETSELPPLAEAMVEIEHVFDRLKLIEENRWKSPAESPDLDPPHEALLLREHYTELAREDAVRQKPAAFRTLLGEGEQAAGDLEQALRQPSADAIKRASAAFSRVTANCTACHRQFRDVPQEP